MVSPKSNLQDTPNLFKKSSIIKCVPQAGTMHIQTAHSDVNFHTHGTSLALVSSDTNMYHTNLFRLGLLGSDNAYVILQVATTVQRYTMPPISDLHHIYTGSRCP